MTVPQFPDFHSLEPAFALLARGWAVAALVMLVLWAVQLRTKNATPVDIGWAANLGILAAAYAWLAPQASGERRWLLVALVVLWSARLAWHLASHRLGTAGEDGRYRELRARWGSGAPLKFFALYQVQALLDAALSLPFALIALNPAPELHWTEFAAVGLWVLAIVGESIADRQLAAFKQDPENKGKTCRVGLWSTSRHPNYFFEWLVWCAFALLAISAPWGGLGLLAPALILFLIVCVSGIPPTEAQALRSRGDDYRQYQRTTSALLPWFPKKESVSCGTNP